MENESSEVLDSGYIEKQPKPTPGKGRLEIVMLLLALLALILKMAHLAGGGLFTVIILSTLTLIYWCFGFALFNSIRLSKIFNKAAYQGISAKRIIGGIVTGLVLSVGVIGVMFKFLSWPGAMAQLQSGLFLMVIVAIVAAYKMLGSKDGYYSKILKRLALFGAICAFLVFLPLETWLNWKYPNHPDYVKAELASHADPGNQELRNRVKEEGRKMIEQQIEEEMRELDEEINSQREGNGE